MCENPNPDVCPDRESNWRPFALQAGAPPLSHTRQGKLTHCWQDSVLSPCTTDVQGSQLLQVPFRLLPHSPPQPQAGHRTELCSLLGQLGGVSLFSPLWPGGSCGSVSQTRIIRPSEGQLIWALNYICSLAGVGWREGEKMQNCNWITIKIKKKKKELHMQNLFTAGNSLEAGNLQYPS